jgi:hypothetical protein
MEVMSLLSLFSKQKTCPDNGFRQAFMETGGLIAIQKDGQVMNMGWTGCSDALIRKLTK